MADPVEHIIQFLCRPRRRRQLMAVYDVGPNDRLIIVCDLPSPPPSLTAGHSLLIVDRTDVDVFIVRNGRTNPQEERRNAL